TASHLVNDMFGIRSSSALSGLGALLAAVTQGVALGLSVPAASRRLASAVPPTRRASPSAFAPMGLNISALGNALGIRFRFWFLALKGRNRLVRAEFVMAVLVFAFPTALS